MSDSQRPRVDQVEQGLLEAIAMLRRLETRQQLGVAADLEIRREMAGYVARLEALESRVMGHADRARSSQWWAVGAAIGGVVYQLLQGVMQ